MKVLERYSSDPRNRLRGFTLVELLVVISVIGILMGLSIPALFRARENAKRTKCLSNVKQLRVALQLHTDTHDGRVPPRDYQGGAVWVDRLKPYYIDRKLLRCPTDPRGRDQSYLMNGFIDYFTSVPLQVE